MDYALAVVAIVGIVALGGTITAIFIFAISRDKKARATAKSGEKSGEMLIE